MSSPLRRALVGLVVAAAALAALPASALASITPALTLDQTAGTTAGSSPAIGFNVTFSPSTGDSVKDVTFAMPPGLLANESIAGGACLASPTPNPACQVSAAGSTVTVAGAPLPATAYLVAPPKPTDVAGLAITVAGNTLTGDVTLSTTGLGVAFSNFAPGITAMNITFTNLRLPTSCPSPAANVTLTADSQNDPTAKSATAPLAVTGCSGLAYAPNLTAAIASDSKGGAALTLGITQTAAESANKTIAVALPSNAVTPNAGPLLPCLSGSSCTIGTATATSPLVPIPLKGAVTLSGSATSPTFAIVFPAPINVTINGTVSLATNSVTFSNVADIPLTALTLNVTGPSAGPAFTTTCDPATVTGSFTAQGGQTHAASAAITYTGCQAKPTASGSTGGLAKGHPKLTFKVVHGKGAPNVATVAIGLPGGLKFSRSAISSKKTCTTLKNKKKKCTTTTLIKGLGIKGGTAKNVAIKGGKLVVTLKKAAGTVTFTISGPLVSETKGLQTKVQKHKTKTLSFGLKITDAKGKATTLPALKLKAH